MNFCVSQRREPLLEKKIFQEGRKKWIRFYPYFVKKKNKKFAPIGGETSKMNLAMTMFLGLI